MDYHALALSCGWVAVGTTFGGTSVQFARARRRGVEGVSLATWTLFVLMGLFWIAYGVTRGSATIVLGSLLVLPLQVALVVRLRPWRAWPVVARAVGFAVGFCVLPTLVWGWPGGVYGTGIAMVLNRTPQIVALVRHGDAAGVSVAMWSLGVAGAVLWVIYYQSAHLWAAMIATSLAGVASLSIALLARWRHHQAHPLVRAGNDLVHA